MNTANRKSLPGTKLDYFDTRAAVEAIRPGAYDKLPYVSRVLAENLVRRCPPESLAASLGQIVQGKRDLDFPWFPARVVCHDILGQTALVDLAGLRDAIAAQGGDPALVNPVVETQLVVDHSLAVERGGFEPDAFEQNRAIEDRRNEDRFHFIDWSKKAFRNIVVIPPGNGILHQINLERMSPVVQVNDGVVFPDTLVGTDSHTPMVDALGVLAIGVGGLEAEGQVEQDEGVEVEPDEMRRVDDDPRGDDDRLGDQERRRPEEARERLGPRAESAGAERRGQVLVLLEEARMTAIARRVRGRGGGFARGIFCHGRGPFDRGAG